MSSNGREYRYALEMLALRHLQSSPTSSLNHLPPESLSSIQAKTIQRLLEELMWGISGDWESGVTIGSSVVEEGQL